MRFTEEKKKLSAHLSIDERGVLVGWPENSDSEKLKEQKNIRKMLFYSTILFVIILVTGVLSVRYLGAYFASNAITTGVALLLSLFVLPLLFVLSLVYFILRNR